MTDYIGLIGKKCEWQIVKIMKHDWKLECDGVMVATLKAKKRFGKLFEADFDGVNMEIEYHRTNDSSIISNSINRQIIGVIEGTSRLHIEGLGKLPEPALFKTEGKAYQFTLKRNSGYVISNEDGMQLAVTDFDNRHTPVKSAFTLLSLENVQISPWLLAIVGQYYAINHAYGTVA